MNCTVDRGDGEHSLRLTLWLNEDEARRIASTIRELLGDTKPPAKPQAWVRLEDRPENGKAVGSVAPLPPATVRAEIASKLNGGSK